MTSYSCAITVLVRCLTGGSSLKAKMDIDSDGAKWEKYHRKLRLLETIVANNFSFEKR